MSINKKRWYDERPEIIKSIQLLETFPKEVQSIIAKGIISLANDEFEASEVLKSYKSLGSEKIMGLHKSQSKARILDSNPDTFKAMTYMYVLSTENQTLMASKIVEVSEFIYQYFKACKAFQEDPSNEEIQAITETYIKKGSDETQKLLHALENIVYQRKEVPIKDQSLYGYEEDRTGMKIID